MNIKTDYAAAGEGISGKITDFNLLANLADCLGQDIRKWPVINLHFHQRLRAAAFGGQQSTIPQFFRDSQKIFISGDKIRLAAKGHHRYRAAVGTFPRDQTSLGCFAIGPLLQGSQSFFAKQLHSRLKIAIGLFEGLFAVHHPLAAGPAKFHYIRC